MRILQLIAAVTGLYRRPESSQIVVSTVFGIELIELSTGTVEISPAGECSGLYVNGNPVVYGPKHHLKEVRGRLLTLRPGQSALIEDGGTLNFHDENQAWDVFGIKDEYAVELDALKDIIGEIDDGEVGVEEATLRKWFLSDESLVQLWGEYRAELGLK